MMDAKIVVVFPSQSDLEANVELVSRLIELGWAPGKGSRWGDGEEISLYEWPHTEEPKLPIGYTLSEPDIAGVRTVYKANN